ncbi:MAG: glycoside hydrolase family 3 C-terminal domain-containing protein [Sphingomonadaceae bacterium]|nr:glycoside hydrolase family 3 C-terminal domain-containing protein [Sphingomonadaceae bacterium]
MSFRNSSIAAICLLLAAGAAAAYAPPDDANSVANPSNWPSASTPEAITSPNTEKQIDALLRRMSLEQKVGQLIQADISAIKPADLKKYPLGSILAGGNSGPYGDERASAAKWKQLTGEFRTASRRAGAGIPILFGIDAVHGHSNLPEATIFPHNIGLGATRDVDLIRRIGEATAAEISGSGIEWTFAPTLAVPQDLRWGRTYEGYSSDPELIASYAKAMTLGLQGELVSGKPLDAKRVAATAKHFLADGGTAEGRDQGDAQISESELIAKHAAGYPASINAGALTVMASFSSWNGVKHHGNKSLLTDVLKGRMGFDGLVVGDWNGHGQVAGCSATDCPAAINAGLDLFMAPDSWKALFGSTLAAARDGRIPKARIDDAVRRIIRVKFKLGLMGNVQTRRGDTSLVGKKEHLELAREAVSKSLVLLKNDAKILPIRRGARVLIAGSGAENMAMQSGGWTISWQGTDTTAADFANGQTIGRAISEAVKANGGAAAFSASGTFATKPDVAVVVVGEKPYAEFEGDVPHLAFQPQPDETEMIARFRAQGIPVVVIFLSGRPMFTGKLINQADAFVAAWLPGTQGRGVADVLVAGADGKTSRDFTGRLPFAWPADARSPLIAPLFPVGYGLDYTRPGRLAPVNEDPRVDMSALTVATHYVIRGKVPAPWNLQMDGSISTRAVDLAAQEDARQFTWNADGTFVINGPAVDLSKQLEDGGTMLIDWRIDRPANGPVTISFGGGTLDFEAVIRGVTPGTATQTRIPLRCFAEAGAKFAAVGSPIRMQAPKGLVATIRHVHIETSKEHAPCPGKAR